MKKIITRCDRCQKEVEQPYKPEDGMRIDIALSGFSDLCEDCDQEWVKELKKLQEHFKLPGKKK